MDMAGTHQITFFKKISISTRLQRRRREKMIRRLRKLIVTDQNKADGLFDAEWYAYTYPDVIDDNQDPFLHYIHHGHKEGRVPGPEFDTSFYKATYPDVVASGDNPLVHYLRHGRVEGRAPNARAFAPHFGGNVRHVIVKELNLVQGGEAAIVVTHAPAGRLKPHVLPYMQHLRGNGISVLLVAVVDRPLELCDEEIAAAGGIIVRDNGGYDFGAWAHAFQLYPALYGASLLIMTNDSVIPTADGTVFRTMVERVRDCRADIVALTASHEYGWHVQSYFLGLKPKALSSLAFQHFIRNVRRIDNKDEVIRTYEVPFAAKMQAGGLIVQALFTGVFSANPTLFSWRDLIEQGFPFIKLLMLRKQFAGVADWPEVLKDVNENWPTVLEAAGFDVNLVRASILAADIAAVPSGSDTALVINPAQFDTITDDHPLRVAYFGPWNYDNGLGSASRELLCALRRTNIRLNAYPVFKPFHIHRLICPAVETIDFSGRPDIAIVHLNPDSWNVLTDEQRQIIRSAKQRIGYWVWETDTLPGPWNQEFHSVDRIWAPSSYCAEVFATKAKVPVDVIPHPVRIPARIASDRETVLRRFGIDPKQRVILYIFDGASYLVRKNPEALICAFGASGLAARGWTLVLKTKHLYDRPEAGRALTELASATPGVQLLEVSLYAEEVTSLLAAADIYASPHCSEGFGLTVAEAMAVGKPVVATDYSGTCDFLDSTCGYPVAAKLWTLEESHGHYLAGHSWAKVDEAALAAALEQAATAIDNGDQSPGVAAKANIARLLSYEAVAYKIEASLAAVVAGSAAAASPAASGQKLATVPPAPQITVKLSSAKAFDALAQSKGVVPIPLAKDMSWDGHALSDGNANDWLFFAPGNARVSPDAIHHILSAATQRPDVSLFYADDVAADEDMLDRVRLKPDFDRTLLIAQDYIGAPVIVQRKTLLALGGLDRTRGTAVLYDLVLRAAEAGQSIGRITQVLIGYEDKRPTAKVEERRAAIAARKGFDDIDLFDGERPGLLLQRRRFAQAGYPAVTLVIPTQRTRKLASHETYVERLLTCIAHVDWPHDRLTVIVGDDIAGEPTWETTEWPFKLKRMETLRPSEAPFNYAAKMNFLWRTAIDEHIIFLNDDVAPANPGWLAALLGFAADESVGGVGGRLYYEDGSIQHAGMFPTLRTVAHAWLGWPVEAKTYQNWAVVQREWSAVTGAVFATRRSILNQVNGFDERLSLEFNDVDLCLRIRNLGYRIVYNPDAQFTHTEKASRRDTIPPGEEVALFLSRWSRWLENDPAAHPGLAKNRLDLVAAPQSGSWYCK